MNLRRFLSVLALSSVIIFGALPLQSSGAATFHQSLSNGSLRVTLTYQAGRENAYNTRNLELSIAVDGRVRYSHLVKGCALGCDPGFPRKDALRIQSLGPGNRHDVVVSLWTGGASCCTEVQVFHYGERTHRFTMTQHNFGGIGAPPLKYLGHNGVADFMGVDYSFSCEFTDCAASGEPLRILDFSHGHFHNVTRRFPLLIKKNAAMYLRLYEAQLKLGVERDPLGLFAAWAADEDSLGHEARVRQFFYEEERKGIFSHHVGINAPLGKKFLGSLDKFLSARGYLGHS